MRLEYSEPFKTFLQKKIKYFHLISGGIPLITSGADVAGGHPSVSLESHFIINEK